jgi:alkaline phosphatase D
MKKYSDSARGMVIAIALCLFIHPLQAQKGPLVSGPMIGQVEYRTAAIWLEPSQDATSASIRYWKNGQDRSRGTKLSYKETLGKAFNPITLQIGGLEPGTEYQYELEVVSPSARTTRSGSFRTKELWQWRKDPPEVHFLAGSCNYVNEPGYDRPGKPYGGDSSIFLAMAKEKSDFMLWLGDNWYIREVDYYSEWGLWYRASHDRAAPVMQPLLKAMPQYAIWDDHDFGPNDMGKEFVLKDKSREVFSRYWANPSYGEDGKGTYSKITYSDVDIFLLDDRTWRSTDDLEDSVNGQPNPIKKMYGDQQMDWLKNALAGSHATFKIIATGSQVLNPVSPFDCFRKFPIEYHALLKFLKEERISGVLFLTGDRHHSEVIRTEGWTDYPLYDITSSPLTSGTHVFGPAEKNNPGRVYGLDQKQNYAMISITGKPSARMLNVTFKGIQGEVLGQWSVPAAELKAK